MKKSVLSVVLTCIGAYVLTVSVVASVKPASAMTGSINAGFCHAGTDNKGSGLSNQGMLSNTTGSSQSIYCPMITNPNNAVDVDVVGSEGTDGSNSRTCACATEWLTCSCSTSTNWVNNSSNSVANNLNTSAWNSTGATGWFE